MVITNIVPKRQKLSAIYIDGEFALKLDTEIIIASKFTIGSEIDDDELKDLIEQSNLKRSKEKALWLLSYRDHSKQELQTKLAKDSDSLSAQKAVERMEELGLINDEKYARRYADELINVKHLSTKGALYKLTQKGIDKNLAQEILNEFDVDPQEHIRIIVDKKYKKDILTDKGKRKAVAGLQRMGYNWNDINSVLKDYFEDEYI